MTDFSNASAGNTSAGHSHPANHLRDERSPYLRQHVHNPVDWYPWGDEALEKSKREDKPIFLSIGYSACHWCHVMERESFENEEIAEVLNSHFVPIKVDREERPDLDAIYMNAVMALTGSGGWPMSVFLTPEQKPFYGGTYWPPHSRGQMPGFLPILNRIREAWSTQRDDLDRGAEELTSAISRMGGLAETRTTLAPERLSEAMASLLRSVDQTHGGFGQAPKFPHPMDLRVLMRAAHRFGHPEADRAVMFTLEKMAAGGIYDHLGGGFHRYSVDARWLVPHFEKMLYDNALLTVTYLEAWQKTGDPLFQRVVDETLNYVLREMTDPQGGFYATQDADSEGEEGKFFVWSEAEVEEVLNADSTLPEETAELFKLVYDVTPDGNWEGKTILNRSASEDFNPNTWNISPEQFENWLRDARDVLRKRRETRVPPGTDHKILTGWNGLMITAFAKAAQVFGTRAYRDAACSAADFLLEHLRDDHGNLLHAHQEGVSRFDGFLDDYAALILGLIDLHELTLEARWLDEAITLCEQMIERFRDPDGAGFFYTPGDAEELVTRQKDSQDTATPSGNSLAVTALVHLAALTNRSDFRTLAEATLERLATQFVKYPSAGGQALIALDLLLGPLSEVVFLSGTETDQANDVKMLSWVFQPFIPGKVVTGTLGSDEPSRAVSDLMTGRKRYAQPALYVCRNYTCEQPAIGEDQIYAAVGRLAGEGH